ncbi:FMN-dependent NADH-azoreductase [Flagellimonas flava]|uniref:FMN dependent NADH:quinone oxidoreductase n=1 Tax=Flagellimonas flava TaxID=570519 RepID=A0A1M5PMD4_9FLAO|nr:NAD(P)H-dependent oxidoreductase [Allomuricauda flava]SHH02914.1 FMN-dependent NADH-azoreductase [Allomuricauda flava]
MKTLLRIDCSARKLGSHSRELTDYFEARWKQSNPGGRVVHRDLTREQLPHIQNNTIEGFHVSPDKADVHQKNAVALSDRLIAELKKADEVVVSSPLYNLNVPSNLKAYMDQVVRAGHTFGMDAQGYHGLLQNKKVFLITSKGGVYKNTPLEKLDFQEPYLKAIFAHMGITDVETFSLEGTSYQNLVAKNKMNIQNAIDSTLKTTTNG